MNRKSHRKNVLLVAFIGAILLSVLAGSAEANTVEQSNLVEGYPLWYDINVNKAGVVGVDAWTDYGGDRVWLYLYDPSGKLIDDDVSYNGRASVTGTSSDSSNGIWRVKVAILVIASRSTGNIHISSNFLLTPPSTENKKELNAGWEVDIKTTRVFAQMDEKGKTHVGFIGTLSNYGKTDAAEVKIEVKILNDGVIPIEPEGGSTDLECFGTKAVYTIKNFKCGDTKDWIIRSEITDPENVRRIDYQVKIFVRYASGGFDNIYSSDKSVEVVLVDTDGDGESDYQEVQAGTDPFDPESNSKKGMIGRMLDRGNMPLGVVVLNLIVFVIMGVLLALFNLSRDPPVEVFAFLCVGIFMIEYFIALFLFNHLFDPLTFAIVGIVIPFAVGLIPSFIIAKLLFK
ncbi:MAG: hypothetical protein KAW47_00880 [Thermoplasmatales archaeon]|nr:hypothetical protein [Thermoplasmatales archaeon]